MIVWSELRNNFKIAQRTDKFKFGTDAVILADFANIKSSDTVADLCSGSGAVGYLAYLKYNQKKTYFVDFDNEMIELSELTAKENCVSQYFFHINSDINGLENKIIKNQSISHITVNPPYFKANSGKTNLKNDIKNARHSCEFSLDVLFEKSYTLLKDGGKISVVHRSEYLSDILFFMRKNNIEPKRIRFVHSYITENSKLVLIEGAKNAKVGLNVLPPLVLYKEKNVLSDEFEKISQFYTKKDTQEHD